MKTFKIDIEKQFEEMIAGLHADIERKLKEKHWNVDPLFLPLAVKSYIIEAIQEKKEREYKDATLDPTKEDLTEVWEMLLKRGTGK